MVWYRPRNARKGGVVSFLSKLKKFDEEPLSLFIFSICHRQEYGNILCSNIIDTPQPSDFNRIHFVHPWKEIRGKSKNYPKPAFVYFRKL